MAEVLGTASAVVQLLECTFKITLLVAELRSNTKNGLSAVLDQIDWVTQFDQIVKRYQQDSEQSSEADSLIESCLKESHKFHTALQAFEVKPGATIFGKVLKVVRWKAKEKELARLFSVLRDNRMNLSTYIESKTHTGIQNIRSLVTEIGNQVSDIHSRVAFSQQEQQVSANRLSLNRPEGYATINFSTIFLYWLQNVAFIPLPTSAEFVRSLIDYGSSNSRCTQHL